jgi:hypothetical protein
MERKLNKGNHVCHDFVTDLPTCHEIHAIMVYMSTSRTYDMCFGQQHTCHDLHTCSRMYACHLCVCAKRDREYSHACRQGHTRTAKRPNMPRSIRHSQSSLTAPVCMRESASRCSTRVFMWPWVPLGLISIVV